MSGLKKVHLISSLSATSLIALFFCATLAAELLGSHLEVARVKKLIVTPGLWVLVPIVASVGITGNLMTRDRRGRLLRTKQRRTAIVAATGLLVLVPTALILNSLASRGSFDALFYAVQSLELLAGASNLTLMSLNIYDGLRLSGRIKPSKRTASA